MGEFFLFIWVFFSGWRRKLGLVTLVLASLLLSGWARSFSIRDVLAFKRDKSTIVFRSFEGGIGWQRFTPSSSLASTGWKSEANFKFSIFDPWWRFDNFAEEEIDWRWDWGGFSFGAASKKEPEFLKRQLELWIVPYWSLVIPLTAVSLWLLLSKPRNTTRVKVTEPAGFEGS